MTVPWLQPKDTTLNRALFLDRLEKEQAKRDKPIQVLVTETEPTAGSTYLIFVTTGKQLKKQINLKNAYDNVIPHKLGRSPKGWRVLKQYSTASIIEGSYVEGFNSDNYLILNCSADVTIELEILP